MRNVGRAAGWGIIEHQGRYYVRLEEVVSILSGPSTPREILAKVLADDPTPDDDEQGE